MRVSNLFKNLNIERNKKKELGIPYEKKNFHIQLVLFSLLSTVKLENTRFNFALSKLIPAWFIWIGHAVSSWDQILTLCLNIKSERFYTSGTFIEQSSSKYFTETEIITTQIHIVYFPHISCRRTWARAPGKKPALPTSPAPLSDGNLDGGQNIVH